jgi:hypothetical protein
VGHVRLSSASQLTLVGGDGGQTGATDEVDVATEVVLVKTRD